MNDKRRTTVSVLGVLNGLFGVDERGWGAIGINFYTRTPGGD